MATDPAECQQIAVSDKCAVVKVALAFIVPPCPANIKLGQRLCSKQLHMHHPIYTYFNTTGTKHQFHLI